MTRTPRPNCRLGTLALLAVATGMGAVRADRAPGPGPAVYDCGTMALYSLLRLEGRPVALSRLGTRLPPRASGEHSMKDLRAAARAFGLDLTGVRLARTDRAPDRPMLAFLSRGAHGHFLVVRPVGHTGRLVQVIDSAGEPEVLDAVRLHASPAWTGLALVPSRPDWAARGAGVLLLGASIAVLVRNGARLRRRRGVARAAPAAASGRKIA